MGSVDLSRFGDLTGNARFARLWDEAGRTDEGLRQLARDRVEMMCGLSDYLSASSALDVPTGVEERYLEDMEDLVAIAMHGKCADILWDGRLAVLPAKSVANRVGGFLLGIETGSEGQFPTCREVIAMLGDYPDGGAEKADELGGAVWQEAYDELDREGLSHDGLSWRVETIMGSPMHAAGRRVSAFANDSVVISAVAHALCERGDACDMTASADHAGVPADLATDTGALRVRGEVILSRMSPERREACRALAHGLFSGMRAIAPELSDEDIRDAVYASVGRECSDRRGGVSF